MKHFLLFCVAPLLCYASQTMTIYEAERMISDLRASGVHYTVERLDSEPVEPIISAPIELPVETTIVADNSETNSSVEKPKMSDSIKQPKKSALPPPLPLPKEERVDLQIEPIIADNVVQAKKSLAEEISDAIKSYTTLNPDDLMKLKQTIILSIEGKNSNIDIKAIKNMAMTKDNLQELLLVINDLKI